MLLAGLDGLLGLAAVVGGRSKSRLPAPPVAQLPGPAGGPQTPHGLSRQTGHRSPPRLRPTSCPGSFITLDLIALFTCCQFMIQIAVFYGIGVALACALTFPERGPFFAESPLKTFDRRNIFEDDICQQLVHALMRHHFVDENFSLRLVNASLLRRYEWGETGTCLLVLDHKRFSRALTSEMRCQKKPFSQVAALPGAIQCLLSRATGGVAAASRRSEESSAGLQAVWSVHLADEKAKRTDCFDPGKSGSAGEPGGGHVTLIVLLEASLQLLQYLCLLVNRVPKPSAYLNAQK